jgi:chaperonin GroEL
MNKEVKFDLDALKEVCAGCEQVKDVALRTLGPGGSTVLLDEYGQLRSTKDGWTAIKGIDVKDRARNMGISLLKQASERLNTLVGDNTTTVVVLSGLMIEGVRQALSVGECNRNQLRIGMDWARDKAFELLRRRSVEAKSPEMLAHVATVSSNGDTDIGRRIADVYSKLDNALIRVELSNSTETTHKVVDGFEVSRGYISHHFVTNHAKGVCEFDRPLVLIHKAKLDSVQAVVPVLQHAAATNRPLLVIAEDIGGEVLATMIINKIRGGLKIAAIKAPGFGSDRDAILQDIAVLTGGTVIASDTGHSLEDAHACFGSATSVVIDKDKTCIINSESDKSKVAARCAEIERELDAATSQYERGNLDERLSKLKYGVAVIEVSGDNETHAKERKDLVEDAVLAVRAAREEGIVAGGGTTYSCISAALLRDLRSRLEDHRDWVRGAHIVIEALAQVEHHILMNALQCRDEVAKIKNILREKRGDDTNSAYGYDAREQQIREDMLSKIMDSTKGVYNCINESVACAKTVANMRAVVVDAPSDDKESENPHLGM